MTCSTKLVSSSRNIIQIFISGLPDEALFSAPDVGVDTDLAHFYFSQLVNALVSSSSLSFCASSDIDLLFRSIYIVKV